MKRNRFTVELIIGMLRGRRRFTFRIGESLR